MKGLVEFIRKGRESRSLFWGIVVPRTIICQDLSCMLGVSPAKGLRLGGVWPEGGGGPLLGCGCHLVVKF
jgi:hypothetical protein